MEPRTPPAEGTTMRRWMVVVGVFFLVMGIGLLPWANDARIAIVGLEAFYTGGDLTTDDTAYRYLLDWTGVFGTTLLVLGGMLLVVSRQPVRNRAFAHLVIWGEVVRGVLADVWFISRDYIPNEPYYAFIVVHLVVIVTGIRALRRTPTATAAATTAQTTQPRVGR